MKLALLDQMGTEDLDFLREFAPSLDLAAPQTESDALAPLVNGARAILSKRVAVSDEVMAAAGRELQFVQLWSNRRDRIDLEAARRRGITVALMPQVGCIAVAELALLLMLGVSKKVHQGHRATVAGAYRELGVEPIRTEERMFKFQWMKLPDLFELNGRTLGLVGFGEIAMEVARRARAFGMRVNYYKRERLDPAIEAEEGVGYLGFDQLLEASDLVSLHVPLTAETERLMDRAALARMKPTAYLINTCRGGVIDEDALIDALKSKRIAGAGLDVFLYEPIPHDHELLRLENVLLTPHIGGGSGGARVKQARDVMTNILRFSRKELVTHVI